MASLTYLQCNAFEYPTLRRKWVAELDVLEVILVAVILGNNQLVLFGLLDGRVEVGEPKEVVGSRVGFGEACKKYLLAFDSRGVASVNVLLA